MWCHLLLVSPIIGLGLFLILPWTAALPLYLVILALSLFLYAKIMQSMRRPVTTGQEALLGQIAEIGPEGSLKVAGERWLIADRKGWPQANAYVSSDSAGCTWKYSVWMRVGCRLPNLIQRYEGKNHPHPGKH